MGKRARASIHERTILREVEVLFLTTTRHHAATHNRMPRRQPDTCSNHTRKRTSTNRESDPIVLQYRAPLPRTPPFAGAVCEGPRCDSSRPGAFDGEEDTERDCGRRDDATPVCTATSVASKSNVFCRY